LKYEKQAKLVSPSIRETHATKYDVLDRWPNQDTPGYRFHRPAAAPGLFVVGEPVANSIVDSLLLFDPVAPVEARARKFSGRAVECTGQPCHSGAVGWPARLGLVRPRPGVADGHRVSGGAGSSLRMALAMRTPPKSASGHNSVPAT
jgi:hypothetical protein